MSLFHHENEIGKDENEVDMLPRGIDEKISYGPAKTMFDHQYFYMAKFQVVFNLSVRII